MAVRHEYRRHKLARRQLQRVGASAGYSPWESQASQTVKPQRDLSCQKTATGRVKAPSSSFQKLPWPFLWVSLSLSGPSLLCWRCQPRALVLTSCKVTGNTHDIPGHLLWGWLQGQLPRSPFHSCHACGPSLAPPEVYVPAENIQASEQWFLEQHELHFLGIKREHLCSHVLEKLTKCFCWRNVSPLVWELAVFRKVWVALLILCHV